jgi:hypothetical protein
MMNTVDNIVGDNFAKIMRFLSRKLCTKYSGGQSQSFLLDSHRYWKDKKYSSYREFANNFFLDNFHSIFF